MKPLGAGIDYHIHRAPLVEIEGTCEQIHCKFNSFGSFNQVQMWVQLLAWCSLKAALSNVAGTSTIEKSVIIAFMLTYGSSTIF